MSVNIDLTGKVVLVTGGVRGVGRGIGTVLIEAGATVIACARRRGDYTGEFLQCDVRDPDAVEQMVDDLLARHGRIDGLVNNAGGSPPSSAADGSNSFHSKIVELNLLAPLIVSKSVNQVMQRQDDGGVIVMISSVSAVRPSPGTAAYGAAKAGIDNLTTSLAIEWSPRVRVVSVTCGMIETEQSRLHYGGPDGIAAAGATVPLGRLAAPRDIGNGVAFLLSPLASYINGAALTIHGGGERPAFLDAVRKVKS